MKNIGFMAVKNKYSNDYKNIALVFNDVDTTPANKTTIPDYSTKKGTIKHFYGYNFALGGIVSILAGDFEQLNGFPNYYSWGFEDNELNARALKAGMTIDRSVFYPIYDNTNIVQITHGTERIVNRGEFNRFAQKVKEGLDTIYGLKYAITEHETNIVNVEKFETKYNVNESMNASYDISKGKVPFITGYSAKRRSSMNMII
jgi:hypothetical protein